MTIEHQFALVDNILDSFKNTIGEDFYPYRNHIYRVVNLCYFAGDFNVEEREKIQIAAVFHDIGIWTGDTLDYLPPSIQAAQQYLVNEGKEEWIEEVSEMIEMHHGIKTRANSVYPLVEVFRRADIADFSLGLFRMGFPTKLISTLKKEFPNNGFHKLLLQLGLKWFVRHPLNPIPMFRI